MRSNYCFTFTVLTPTYNRAHLLGRAYESLKEQTFRDFEWIVVDDGSEDNTGQLVRGWEREADFVIRYVWQPNSGTHVAINQGVKLAQGRYIIVLDSDDWLAPNSLEKVLYNWESIPEAERDRFVGVVGLYAYPTGEVVGTPFPFSVLDSNAVEIRTRYRVQGDKFGMNRTDVLRQFPFPEGLGKYVTPSLVWNRIARKYKTRFVNEVFAFKEYQPGGLSARSVEIRISSNKAARLYYKEFAEIGELHVPFIDRLKACANYVRFSLHGQVPLSKQFTDIGVKLCWLLAFPVGFGVYLMDRMMMKINSGGKS